jgi:hypothetical protein
VTPPPDKPGRTGQEAETEHTSAIATSGQAQQVDQTGGSHEGNGAAPATAHVAGADDLELSHGTPPPWQRVASDTQTQQLQPPGRPPEPPGERTVQVERPVVTGSAANRLFGAAPDAPTVNVPHSPPPNPATPPGGIPSAARTTVNLDSSGNPSSGPLRVGTSAAAAPSALRRPGRGPRRANLQIKRFDPWSVLKLSLVLGVALFFVWLVAVGILYAVLDGMGVWDNLNGISDELLQGSAETGTPLISAGRVFGVAAIIGAVNIVLFSALSTVGAFIYNVSADLAGGLEVTLAERE